MKVLVIAVILAAAAAQRLPSVLLARPGSFQGDQVFTSGGVLQSNNFDQSQQFQGQNNQFQSGFTTISSQGQNNQFLSGSSFDNQQQNIQIQSGDSFEQQQQNNQFQSSSLLSGQNTAFQQQQQNNQFQSSSLLSGQNTAFQSGLSFVNQGQGQIQPGISVVVQGNNNQGQLSSSQFQTSRFEVSGESSNIVNGQFEPLNLPAGASLLLGNVETSFQCADRPYGYYADPGNDCRIFHICNPYLFEDGRVETYQYSFLCGEGTIFDQKELICAEQFSALSCSEAPNFYFRNEKFGRADEQF